MTSIQKLRVQTTHPQQPGSDFDWLTTLKAAMFGSLLAPLVDFALLFLL